MILGSSPKVVSIGEFVYFNTFLERKVVDKCPPNFECTCGEELAKCSFWSSVLDRVGMASPKVVHDSSLGGRLSWLWRYALYRLSNGRICPSSDKLGDDAALLSAISETAGDDVVWICDSSKDFARYVRLKMFSDVDVYPIHLVRDGRAIAYNYSKPERDALGLPRMGLLSALLFWIGINSVCHLLCLFDRNAIRVEYGDFCRNTETFLERLGRRYDLDIKAETLAESINNATFHNINGNIRRLEKVQAIREDLAWKLAIPDWFSSLGYLIALPFNWLWRTHIGRKDDER